MLHVGLTGGIASGKSVVAQRLAQAGVPTLDLDRLAHELMSPGQPAHREVVAAFGEGILDPAGAIDRAVLGALVFADPEARERLNRIVHPRVRDAEAAHAAALAARGARLLVTEAALLVEAGMHLRFDRLVVVHCPAAAQVARLRERGLGEAAAWARLHAQMPMETKRRFGHLAVDTSGSREDTNRAADELGVALEALCGRPEPPWRLRRPAALGALVHGEGRAPRGLTARVLAEHLVGAGGVDLSLLALRLSPPALGPWYEAGAAGEGPELAAGLASALVPLVLFELGRHGQDEDRLAAAAHSLSWLVERGPERVAAAVCSALALAKVAGAGRVPADLEESTLGRFHEAHEKWSGGALPPRELRAALRAAARHPASPREARAAAAALGGPPDLAGALVGLAVEAREATLDAALVPFLDLLAPTE